MAVHVSQGKYNRYAQALGHVLLIALISHHRQGRSLCMSQRVSAIVRQAPWGKDNNLCMFQRAKTVKNDIEGEQPFMHTREGKTVVLHAPEGKDGCSA